ncbi:hypothetical protein DKC05_00430 (plasmid) [Serratia marcescens]|uniref:Uncharacterized protein n=1 Tax=Serratia marcescens TaxID=615 RepID=A0AB33FTP3_SERMA|nr:hypothetical protein AB188_00280 [Serratia marcescens]AWL66245.1 hypothetical protein DKC05_00430 [Serratia marcescens]
MHIANIVIKPYIKEIMRLFVKTMLTIKLFVVFFFFSKSMLHKRNELHITRINKSHHILSTFTLKRVLPVVRIGKKFFKNSQVGFTSKKQARQ